MTLSGISRLTATQRKSLDNVLSLQSNLNSEFRRRSRNCRVSFLAAKRSATVPAGQVNAVVKSSGGGTLCVAVKRRRTSVLPRRERLRGNLRHDNVVAPCGGRATHSPVQGECVREAANCLSRRRLFL